MRKRVVFVATLLLLGSLGVLAFGLTRSPEDLPSALIGLPAPEFRLEVMKGGGPSRTAIASPGADSARLSSHRGDVVIVNFWASWCLACREEHEALSQTADRYLDRGVQFYGVLYQDTPENARQWIGRMGGQSYPTLLDPDSRTAMDYGVYGVPETYVIDAAGTVIHRHVSAVTESLLEEKIEEALAGAGE